MKVFEILDAFTARGYKEIDTAYMLVTISYISQTNYAIVVNINLCDSFR